MIMIACEFDTTLSSIELWCLTPLCSRYGHCSVSLSSVVDAARRSRSRATTTSSLALLPLWWTGGFVAMNVCLYACMYVWMNVRCMYVCTMFVMWMYSVCTFVFSGSLSCISGLCERECMSKVDLYYVCTMYAWMYSVCMHGCILYVPLYFLFFLSCMYVRVHVCMFKSDAAIETSSVTSHCSQKHCAYQVQRAVESQPRHSHHQGKTHSSYVPVGILIHHNFFFLSSHHRTAQVLPHNMWKCSYRPSCLNMLKCDTPKLSNYAC
jgi:hypothetical protein